MRCAWRHVAGALLLCAMPVTASTNDDAHPVVLAPGNTLDYGVSLDGQAYLALHRQGPFAWTLTAVALRARQADPDSVEVSSAQVGARWFLRHPGLRAGSVQIAGLSGWTQKPDAGQATTIGLLYPGDEIHLKLAAAEARLVKTQNATELHIGAQHAVLSAGGESYPAYLEWGGDLDGDQRIDLIMSFTRDGNEESCLFLSMAAPAGALVRKIGCMMASG